MKTFYLLIIFLITFCQTAAAVEVVIDGPTEVCPDDGSISSFTHTFSVDTFQLTFGLDTSGLNAGTYYLHIFHGKEIIREQIVIQ
jgi:hypothetical protein